MRDLIGELKGLTERRRHKRKKGPHATLGSLQRWLKGATPAIRAYANTVMKYSNTHKFHDDKAAAATTETANILRNMETEILRLRNTVDDALAEF